MNKEVLISCDTVFTLYETPGKFCFVFIYVCRSQWPRGLRRGSTASRLLGLWVRILPGAWMSLC